MERWVSHLVWHIFQVLWYASTTMSQLTPYRSSKRGLTGAWTDAAFTWGGSVNSISMVLHLTRELLKANRHVRAFPLIAESKCVWTALACSSCSCTLGLLWTSPPNTCRWSPLWGSCAFTVLVCGTILWLWSWPSPSCSLSRPCWCHSTPPARLWPSPVWPR